VKFKLLIYSFILIPAFCIAQYPEMNWIHNNAYFNPAYMGLYDKTTIGINYAHQNFNTEGNQFRQCFVYNIFPNLLVIPETPAASESSSQLGVQYTSRITSENKKDEYSFLYNHKMGLGTGELSLAISLAYGSYLSKERDIKRSFFNSHIGANYKSEKYTIGFGERNLNKPYIKFDTDTIILHREIFLTMSSKHKILDNGTVDYVDTYLINSIALFTDFYSLGYILNSSFYYKYFGLGVSFKHDLYNYNLVALNVGLKIEEKAELFFSTYLPNDNEYFNQFGNRYEMTLIYMLK